VTVISCLINRAGTFHATDSLLTRLGPDGQREPLEWQETKIVPVPAWRGAMSYWGLALIEQQWSTLDWLRAQAKRAAQFESAAAFAEALAVELRRALAGLRVRRDVDAGIGIHFTAYEWIDDYWIPELFLVTNWSDPTYTALRPTGVGMSRETHGTFSGEGPRPDDSDPGRRRAVSRYLQAGGWFIYNNGDPELFNPAANSILHMFRTLSKRGILRGADDIGSLGSLTRRPIEVVSAIQHDFCASGTRVVGGKIHDLAITPTGIHSSTSGDSP